MNEATSLFETLLTSLVESLLPDSDTIFNEFVFQISSNLLKADDILEKCFKKFPNSNIKYKKMIETITSFAASNPISILSNSCEKFKYELNRSPDQPPSIITISSISYRSSSFHHFQFVKYLNLIFLTDMIKSFFIQFPNRQIIPIIVKSGYDLCTLNSKFKNIKIGLIRIWSEIFQCVSTISLQEISISLEQYSDYISDGNIFTLVSKVKANSSFIDSILFFLKQCRRHKTITPEMLYTASSLISITECSEDVLIDFFTIAWGIKQMKELKCGSIDLICVLFNKIPQLQKKALNFFNHKIFEDISKDNKVESSLKAFLHQLKRDLLKKFDNISSNYSNITISDSSPSLFMRTFFTKSNFAICPDLFAEVLAHIAYIDFLSFQSLVLPLFLKLDIFDPKYVCLIKAIILINSDSFYLNSNFGDIKSQLANINDMVLPSVLSSLDKVKKYANDEYLILPDEIEFLHYTIDEADGIVLNFLTNNNISNFDQYPKKHNKKLQSYISFPSIQSLICILPFIIDEETFKESELPILILKFICHTDHSIHLAAHKVYETLTKNKNILSIFLEKFLYNIFFFKEEVIAECLYLIITALNLYPNDIPNSIYKSIELSAFCMLTKSFSYCRLNCLIILKYLSANGFGSIYNLIRKNYHVISEAVNRSLLIDKINLVLSSERPIIGFIDYEQACFSRFTDLWLIYFSQIMNVIINCSEINCLCEIQAIIHSYIQINDEQTNFEVIDRNQYLGYTMLYLLYIDSFFLNNSLDIISNNPNQIYDDALKQFTISTFKSNYLMKKKIFINAFKFSNWKVVTYIFPLLVHILDNKLYPEMADALVFIMKNNENLDSIVSQIFRYINEFLSLLQSYFIQLGINSTREIIWNDNHIEILINNLQLCTNYCILISETFNNIHDQISEEEWPLSYRQVLVRFLVHWEQLPDSFEKLKFYALNALIPIIHAGTVFTEGFSLDLSLLDLLLQYQMKGYSILDSLLLFHLDILLDEFVKNCIIQPKREARVFLNAILSAIESCNDVAILQTHVGALVMLALIKSYNNENKEFMEKIYIKIKELFIHNNNIEERQDNFSIENVAELFHFATEQIINSGFEILKFCKNLANAKQVILILQPFFLKIRLLPTKSFIVQGVPAKFRKFTLISFFDSMYNVSSSLNDEIFSMFISLWYTLLQSSDNCNIVLLYLFESNDNLTKEKIFSQLLEKEPAIVSDYLSQRYTFSYWYFLHTQRHLTHYSISWILPIIIRCFTEFVENAASSYTICLHYSLLYIEECRELFEALIAIAGIEVIDSQYLWSKAGPDDSFHIKSAIANISTVISEESVFSWSEEAIKWAVGCSNIKTGYRSLVILNSLQIELPHSFNQLIAKAALYHLGMTSEDEYEVVADFIGECFDLLFKQIKNADVASFAFRFSSIFLNIPVFENYCIKKAMPIFMACTNNPVMMKAAQSVLTDAFIPFLPRIETDDEAQSYLAKIIEINPNSELLFIAAAFLKIPLPFVSVGKTYHEIISTPITTDNAKKIFHCYEIIIKTCSLPLINSIFEITNEILLMINFNIEKQYLMEIFQQALSKITILKSAVDFINTIIRMIPGASFYSSTNQNSKKFIGKIKNDLLELVGKTSEIVPITKCKKISHLNGLIDQKNPPKILPFSSQYEMYQELKKGLSTPKKVIKNWSSSLLLSSDLFSAKSSPNTSNFTKNQNYFIKMELTEIPIQPIKLELIYSKIKESNNPNFIVTPNEFLELGEQ